MISDFELSQESVLPSEQSGPRWYAVYTCANHEKRVAEQLRERSIDHFLPLYETVRRWKDRRKRLQLPLFPGYVFVRFDFRERVHILQIPGLAHIVGFGGQPAPISEEEIRCVRQALGQGLRVEPYPYIRVGQRVRIKSGALAGQEGILLRRKGKCRIVLSVHPISHSIVVEVSGEDIAVN